MHDLMKKCSMSLNIVHMLIIYATVIEPLEDNNYWKQLGYRDIEDALSQRTQNGLAKNVILFVGDGMGQTTITASRIYGKTEKGFLPFEKFPNIGVLKTYSANYLVPDSCSTATALFCGVKANQKTCGVDATVPFDDCKASLNSKAQLQSIISWAQDEGKATGFVTTTRVTHATPSALYAHSASRYWECEAKMSLEASECKDIARQLIEDAPGTNINVIMGGGRQCLVSNINGTDDDPVDIWACYSVDGRNLIDNWKADKVTRGVSHSVVTNNEELKNLDRNSEFVLGIFANSHMKMEHARGKGKRGTPSLTEMTAAAIEILKKKKDGFMLVVEGGLIDFAHHRGHAKQALSETVEFSNAIAKAMDMLAQDAHETIFIVTSDHSHSLVFSGHAERSKSILDIAQKSKIDQKSYTSLLYGTGGPNNYQFDVVDNTVVRRDPSINDTRSFDYSQQSVVLTDEVTHGGTDVLVYATGPMSHLFYSVHEQTYVAYVIGYAAKIGPYKNSACSPGNILYYICFVILLVVGRII